MGKWYVHVRIKICRFILDSKWSSKSISKARISSTANGDEGCTHSTQNPDCNFCNERCIQSRKCLLAWHRASKSVQRALQKKSGSAPRHVGATRRLAILGRALFCGNPSKIRKRGDHLTHLSQNSQTTAGRRFISFLLYLLNRPIGITGKIDSMGVG